MRLAGMALALCLALAGCGSASDGNAAATKKTTPTKATPSVKPTVAAPTGVPAPGDLSDFQCLASAKGVWYSSGVLRNDSKKTVIYQVTVFVGHADGEDTKAKTKQVVVNALGSARVAIAKIPASEGATQCYVQVLAK